MGIPPTAPGDAFMLFSRFRTCVLGEELPMRAGPGVSLERVPREVLDEANPPAWADYLLPGYNVDPFFWADYCLRSPSSHRSALGLEARLLFFNTLAALRLCKPVDTTIEGEFHLGDGQAIEDVTRHHLRSPWKRTRPRGMTLRTSISQPKSHTDNSNCGNWHIDEYSARRSTSPR